jgi:hypothetical protein
VNLGNPPISRSLPSIRICSLSIFLIIISSPNLTIFNEIYSTPIESGMQPTRLSGPIVSLQFASDGTPTWIVSGRWRIDVNYDTTDTLPLSISNVNVSLVLVSTDGEVTERFKLSELQPAALSYDNKTHTLTQNGTIKMIRGSQPIDEVGVNLKLINREVMIISLDPSRTIDYFGSSPIYGVER